MKLPKLLKTKEMVSMDPTETLRMMSDYCGVEFHQIFEKALSLARKDKNLYFENGHCYYTVEPNEINTKNEKL